MDALRSFVSQTSVSEVILQRTLCVALVLLTCGLISLRLIASAIFTKRPARSSLDELPHFVTENDVWAKIQEGHRQYPDQPFVLSMLGMRVVILPHSSIDVIKALPESVVSIKRHHYDVFLGQYSYMGTKADEFDEAMRYDLQRNTPKVLASFVTEVDYVFMKIFGKPQDWKAFQPRECMARVTALMSGRAFVGLPLSRDEEWAEATVTYTQDVTKAWMVLRMIPSPLHWLLAPYLPQVASLKRHKDMTQRKLKPLLSNELSGEGEDDNTNEPGGDMIRWFRKRYKKPATAEELTRDQLLATFASIYNLTNALSYLLFDIATYPEYIEPLRAELDEFVGPDCTINKENIQKLKKLDSFIRESQRLSPPSLANMPRIVTSPEGLSLPGGYVIPCGERVMVRAHTLNLDPQLWENPETFDGFRFEKLRSIPGNELKYQHATTGVDNINFGHGVWACPGRHFASSQMKVVMAYLLRHYDIRLEDGEKKSRQQHFGLAIVPDTKSRVMLKYREDRG
ncbi:Cytochrome P450 monooxygenase ataF [Exophiala dermatitidis]